jgi:hypothetical protein
VAFRHATMVTAAFTRSREATSSRR